ncbi:MULTISPECIES: GNAT family N-acetyltransferase [Kitasatospora]|uniref:Ribosomal protein S18 acetylase RimI-like enzyme n=2 Tax=Kitasatospora TaxID=2063 RepID=A0ABT1IQ96_9ACTN|nr:N-acetyltransferase [Kitasatospora paracochleata]MCP2307169.1 ribosomal protein S18 acetylase RimI-like enzyme [Kitasatospora paracochleata]
MDQYITRTSDVIRVAEESDLDQLSRIDNQIFPHDAYPFFVLRQLYEVHGERFLVLDCDAEMTGYSLLATTPDGKQSWVLGLGVLAHARGLGHGRRLMVESLERLSADRVAEVRLSVEPTNGIALNLYHSLGFSPIDHRPDYFGSGADRLILRLSLSG